MALYRWSSGSVAQLDCGPAQVGACYARLRPAEGADPQALQSLQDALGAQGIAHFIGTGKDAGTILLPQLSNENQLLDLMHKGGWTKGTAQVIAGPGEKTEIVTPAKGPLSIFKKQPLLLSAAFYDLASISWITSGIMRARHNRTHKFTAADFSEMMVGISYGVGNTLLSVFGKEDNKHPMVAFSDELNKHLKAQGITLPPSGQATPESLHKSGFFNSVSDFLNKNVISSIAATRLIGGGFMARAAFKKDNFNPGKMAAGLLVSTGWLTTLLLDKPDALPYEFKSKEELKSPSTGHKMYEWAAENPRGRVTAPLSMLGNLCSIGGVINEMYRSRGQVDKARGALSGKSGKALEKAQAELRYTEGKQYDFGWNILASSSFLVANYIFGTTGDNSHKPKITDHDQFRQEIVTVAANVLANVPEKMRREAIAASAEYIASIKGVYESQAEIEKTIADQIEVLRHGTFMPPPGSGAQVALR